jgi:hypothetical protein
MPATLGLNQIEMESRQQPEKCTTFENVLKTSETEKNAMRDEPPMEGNLIILFDFYIWLMNWPEFN